MACKVRGWKGIAFYNLGHPKIRVPDVVTIEGEDGEEITFTDRDFCYSEGTEEDDDSKLRVVMVGDDKVHVVDTDDVEDIPEDSYCSECGQIGCYHDGRDREDPPILGSDLKGIKFR